MILQHLGLPIGAIACTPPCSRTTSQDNGYARHPSILTRIVEALLVLPLLPPPPLFFLVVIFLPLLLPVTGIWPDAQKQHLTLNYDVYLRATALVAALLKALAERPQPYGSCPFVTSAEYLLESHPSDSVARARSLATPEQPRQRSPATESRPGTRMDKGIDFDDSTGIQTRGKKAAKKAAKAAQQAKWFESDNEEGGGLAGDGGDGAGGGENNGGSAGGDGGGDENNGGGDDEEWDLGGSKKNKKKNKKKQEEEERKKQQEEEQKKQEEQEAAHAGDPLSWADEVNNAATADDDWTTGFTTKKDKKKKNKKVIKCSAFSYHDKYAD